MPQVPVQPVLIRYPNAFDTVTWTFDGPEVLVVLSKDIRNSFFL